MKKKLLIGLLIISILLIIYFLGNSSWYGDINKIFTDVQELKEFITKYGVLAPLVFFILQIIQVIISPIPGSVTIIVGGVLFGLVKGFILNALSVISGSIIAFYLAKYFGRPLVIKLIGPKIYNKYLKVFNKKYLLTLFLMFLFPFFPDDALCFMAGISSLSIRLFFFLIIFGRTPTIFIQTLIGAGMFDFTITNWLIVGLITAIVLLIALRYRKFIEKWLNQQIGEGEIN